MATLIGVCPRAAPVLLEEHPEPDLGAREVIFTNTLPIPDHKRFPGMTVLSIAPLLAQAIHAVFDDGSVTSLFDGIA